MAFSFRSFFGKDKPDDGSAGSSAMTSSPQSHQGGYPFQKGNQTGTYSTKDVFLGASTPANGNGAAYHGASPFSPAISVPSTGLTVEDILPSLPPDVVKPGGVSPGQPLQIPNELLERALRSGQAALPLFEIYRVCPALFRTPIAPQDARFVALPHHKLGGLAALMHKQQPPQAPAPTPAASQSLFLGGNPFQQAAEPPAGAPSAETTLFHPSPFHVDGVGGAVPPPQAAQPMPPSTVQTPFNAFSQFGSPAPAEAAAATPQDVGERSNAPLPTPGPGNPFAPSPAVTSSSSTNPFPPMPGGAGQPFAPFGQPAPAASPSPFGPSNPEPMPPVPAFFGTPPAQSEQAPPSAPATISPPVSPLFTFSHSAPASPAAAPQPAPVPAGPFGNFLPENPPASPGSAFLPPTSSAPQTQLPAQSPPAAPNPFFQPPSSTSGSAGVAPAPAPAPGPALNPFASFGLPTAPPEPSPVPAPAVPPVAAEAAPPSGVAPWQAFSPVPAPAPSPAPPSAPEVPPAPVGNAFIPGPSTFPEAPPAPAATNPFDRIKALSSLPDPSANAMPAAPPGLFGPAPLSAPVQGPAPAPPAPPAAIPQSAAPILPTPPATPFSGVPGPLAEPAPAPAKEKATFGLATVLSKCTEQEIGVKPEQIPSWITVGFPITMLVDQLASGKVTVKLADIMRGLEPEFRSIITPSRPDIVVELPINDVFHALPATITPANLPPAPAAPAEAPAPPITKSADVLGSEALAAMAAFKPASAADSPESQAALPSLFHTVRPEEITANLPSGVPWPFEAAPTLPSLPVPEAPAAPQSLFFGNPTAAEDPPAVPPAFHQQPKTEPVLAPEPPAPLFQATSSLLGLPVDPPTTNRAIRSEAITFGPGVKAEFGTTPHAHLRASKDRNKQLLLRVLLSTEDDLELEDVIRLTGALPGVSAAVCLQDGTIMGHASNGTSEAENFIRQATQIYGHLQPLIQLTGIMDTETLSMKSDQLMASFSLQGDLVLGVLHDPGKNEPTLRERITLIARELKSVVGAAS